MSGNSRLILSIVAKEFDLKRNTIKERLKLQKTIYLLQTFGFQLGYGFSWDKYGPYSQDLADDAYAALSAQKERYESSTMNWKFDSKTLEQIKQFRRKYTDVLDNLPQLELVASVDFVKNTWMPQGKPENFIEKFRHYKTTLYDGCSIEGKDIKKAFTLCIPSKS